MSLPHFPQHFYHFIPPIEPCRTPHRPHKETSPASPALARRVSFLKSRPSLNVSHHIFPINTRGSKYTHGTKHSKEALPIYLGFLRFYSGHTRQTIAATEARTELPVPVERFELRRARISTHLRAKLQNATRGDFAPNKILDNTLEPALSNKPTISTIGSLQNLLRRILGRNLSQGHLIGILLMSNDQFLLKYQCFDIGR